MQDQNRTFLCYYSATNRRTLAFSKQIATSHGKCLLRHWLRQDLASYAFFLIPQQVHERTCRATPRARSE